MLPPKLGKTTCQRLIGIVIISVRWTMHGLREVNWGLTKFLRQNVFRVAPELLEGEVTMQPVKIKNRCELTVNKLYLYLQCCHSELRTVLVC